MLQEILLSLSGHPSPLLRVDLSAQDAALAGISPSERQLLLTAAQLSDLHIKLITSIALINDSHFSPIGRAVAAEIKSIHLAAFQRKILDVEARILKEDPEYVGAYNIVPLTAVIGEFRPWLRRMEWYWDIVQFVQEDGAGGARRSGATIIDRLRGELQSGYQDVAEAAYGLVTVAETAWLKQVSAWILYGRMPNFGADDFFVQKVEDASQVRIENIKTKLYTVAYEGQDYLFQPERLPSFVSSSAASSMLFIGKSLNHVGVSTSLYSSSHRGMEYLSSQMQHLGSLTFPIDKASFTRAIAAIRTSLSQRVLQKILPLPKVIEMLQLFRDYFLLGRGEFAVALTNETDDAIRKRWKKADHFARDDKNNLRNVSIKDGEVATILSKTWAALASAQGQNAVEDESLELARELLQLQLLTSKNYVPTTIGSGFGVDAVKALSSSPFNNLLFSAPADLTLQLPSPLDMVISPSEQQTYSCINSYLLSMRRAHIRLTGLWKITSLRRHHPSIRGADEQAIMLRERWQNRSALLRSSWTTASAAIFLLAETEAYFQTEIVAGLWKGFSAWLNGGRSQHHDGTLSQSRNRSFDQNEELASSPEEEDYDDLWLPSETSHPTDSSKPVSKSSARHDLQTISRAHTQYLRTLTYRLLLTQSSFSTPLHALLVHIDYLVAHIHRLHSLFDSIDLETDSGVIDAFVDLGSEETEVKTLLKGVEQKVKHGIEEVVDALTALGSNHDFAAQWDGDGLNDSDADEEMAWEEGDEYIPARVGGVNRLLMKLDFGSWYVRTNND